MDVDTNPFPTQNSNCNISLRIYIGTLYSVEAPNIFLGGRNHISNIFSNRDDYGTLYLSTRMPNTVIHKLINHAGNRSSICREYQDNSTTKYNEFANVGV